MLTPADVAIVAIVSLVASLITHALLALFRPSSYAASPKVIDRMARQFPAALAAALGGGTRHPDKLYDHAQPEPALIAHEGRCTVYADGTHRCECRNDVYAPPF